MDDKWDKMNIHFCDVESKRKVVYSKCLYSEKIIQLYLQVLEQTSRSPKIFKNIKIYTQDKSPMSIPFYVKSSTNELILIRV